MRFKRIHGYKVFTDRYGREKSVHVRVMEKKLGRPIPRGLVVHHINGDKDDNRPENLVAITPGVHGRLHGRSPDACFICGRRDHWADSCRERKDYAGRWL